jgi:hypothetical protein
MWDRVTLMELVRELVAVAQEAKREVFDPFEKENIRAAIKALNELVRKR